MATSNDNSNTSATDIITYIGVPLAVLGVLPILYNTAATLISLSQIRTMLKRSQLTAMTRSDVVNRVIEIELPRYAVMPLDRFRDRAEYWALSRHPSSIPGGSWTTFNWKTHTIGIKTQRVEFPDQVRQPQVEVAFDDLVCYLLDLGAVPEPNGWKLLRSAGLWTPVGCSLMTSPNGRDKALTVASQTDSDGNLSLAVSWSHSWITRDHSQLPPYWVRVSAQPAKVEDIKGGEDAADEKEQDDSGNQGSPGQHGATSAGTQTVRESKPSSPKAITCQILGSGIASALTYEGTLKNNDNLRHLDIDHLLVRPSKSAGAWFASAATAYGRTTSQTVLWNYEIPADVVAFAQTQSVPCGILVLLDMADNSETPEWATQHTDYGAGMDHFIKRTQASREAMAMESRMNPAQRAQAVQDRMRREGQEQMQEMRDRTRRMNQQNDQRMLEAIQSPRWDAKRIAANSLGWLSSHGHCDKSFGVKETVGFLLHRMIVDAEFASSISWMLDMWKTWADVGGMKRAEYSTVRDNQVLFAQAILLVSLIMEAATTTSGTLSADLQECLHLWKSIRLG